METERGAISQTITAGTLGAPWLFSLLLMACVFLLGMCLDKSGSRRKPERPENGNAHHRSAYTGYERYPDPSWNRQARRYAEWPHPLRNVAMSGLICEIIIRGNRLQANTQSICELGTTTYDGQEVMTDAQQQEAVDLMTAANTKLDFFLKQFNQT